MKGVDQIVDGRHGVLFCDIGEMGILDGCTGICMAEKGLYMAEA